jgi:hypothetical protein
LPIAATIVLGIKWIFILSVHLLFFADRFTIFQNMAIEILNLIVVGGLIALTWALGWEKSWVVGLESRRKTERQHRWEEERSKFLLLMLWISRFRSQRSCEGLRLSRGASATCP